MLSEGHEKFRALAALVCSGTLTPEEWAQLKHHLEVCEECREASLQYGVLATSGIPVLAAAYLERHDRHGWDDAVARAKLMARVRRDRQTVLQSKAPPAIGRQHFPRGIALNRFAQAALAASLTLAVGFGAYRIGARAQGQSSRGTPSSESLLLKLATDKRSEEELRTAQAGKLAQLQRESTQKELELTRLRSEVRVVEDRSNQLVASNSASQGQLQAISKERDNLGTQLQEAIRTNQNLRAELATLSVERDKAIRGAASLEAKVEGLAAVNQDQERRLKDTEQYLASDRDIRELMGARKLYIADVFDVDGGSRTRKPFGRVFYTQGKSLIFYAFDLDREPGFVNASTFQVWGQKETVQGERPLPRNLGILYMDNESNRRWVMRFDGPKQLAEIDAVFVTIEPHGGSQKPTGKPFLYALLRNEVNHP
jgi:hypothetical protein